jgi:3',5'-cyclic AMP phosphodiesterase CpdA
VRTIAHISDVHFGREDAGAAEALLEDLRQTAPSLVVVSGDLTQRARRDQFRRARAFLARIAAPCLIVPGNHDIPLYDVLRRVRAPFGRYRRYIASDLAPLWVDDELAVLGVNTARPEVWKSGKIAPAQIEQIRDRLGPLPASLFRVVVTHHPFIPPPTRPREAVVASGRAPAHRLQRRRPDVLRHGASVDPRGAGRDGDLHAYASRGERVQPRRGRPARAQPDRSPVRG